MKIPVSFCTHYTMADKRILVDSGATDNFIHPKFVRRLHVGTQKLERSMKIWNIDGSTNQAGQLTKFINLLVQTGKHEEKNVIPYHWSRDRRCHIGLPLALHIWTEILLEGWSHWHNPITSHNQITQLAYAHLMPYYPIDTDRKNSNRRGKTEDLWHPHRRKSNWIHRNWLSNQSRAIHRKSQGTGKIPKTSPCIQWRSSTTLPSEEAMGSRYWSETRHSKHHWL